MNSLKIKKLIRQMLFENFFDQERIFLGKEVNVHIRKITPEEENSPHYFMDDVIKKRKFKLKEVSLIKLLQSDMDFREYYESGEKRYDQEDVNEKDLDYELVIVDNELLDGFNRASTMLRNGKEIANAFVAI